jgi:phage terminase large subunit-like protein
MITARRVAKKWMRNPSDVRAVELGCYFDPSIGKRACEFLERFCRQSKGKWAGQLLKLLPWQRDFIMRLFGWRTADGRRRFKSAYLEVPKKNGKSTLFSALAILFLIADGEGAPEIYLNAVDREQASIIYDESARMVGRSPDLSSRLEVIPSRKRIVDPVGNGRIQASSADVPSKDGVNASHVLWDELHRQTSRDMWSIFEYAGASREEPLRLVITTAGESESGIWYEQRLLSQQVNSGTVPDISHLGVIYAAEVGDDLDSPEVWKKANPSLGETIKLEDFRREWEAAKASPFPIVRQNFKRLRFGLVSGGASSFVELGAWDACAGDLSPSELEERVRVADSPCYVGLDLSSVDDLTAVVLISGDEESGIDIIPKFFLPRDNIVSLEREHKVPYREWADEGFITLTDGETVDYEAVKGAVLAMVENRDLRSVISDPYNAYKLAVDLKEKEGLPVVFLRQGFLSLSPPTKELLRLIKSRRIRHGGHPVLRWCVENAVAEKDSASNIKLSKKKSRGKIDGLAALVDAIAGPFGSSSDEGERSVYEERGALILG